MRCPLKTAFRVQRAHAKERGIAFEMTFNEWFDVWDRSGKLPLRGRGVTRYVMARRGDVGPYAIHNVEIIPYSQNSKDARENHPKTLFDLRSKQIGSGRGWTFVDGKYQVTVSKKYIGRFLTEAEAANAYKRASDALLMDALHQSCLQGNPLVADRHGGARE